MKLILEMPPEDQKHPPGNVRTQLSRWMSFAAVAKEVHVIGPKSNPYWMRWAAFFTETTTQQSPIIGVGWASEMQIQDAPQPGAPGFHPLSS